MRSASIESVFGRTVRGLHDGAGEVRGGSVFAQADLGAGAWRFVDAWVVPPGASIGCHRHERGRELYVVMSGRGTMTTNGEPAPVGPGDLVLNEPGDSHSLENSGAEDLRVLVTSVIEE